MEGPTGEGRSLVSTSIHELLQVLGTWWPPQHTLSFPWGASERHQTRNMVNAKTEVKDGDETVWGGKPFQEMTLLGCDRKDLALLE